MGKKRQLAREEERREKKQKLKEDGGKKSKIGEESAANVDKVDEVDRSRLEQVTSQKKEDKRLIVVLEDANLETVKWGKGFGLLNVDEHANILRKHGRDFSTSRPDITHQCLLMLMDSPLNRAGLLQVFIRTANNVLIEINPQTRIPRTFNRFAGTKSHDVYQL